MATSQNGWSASSSLDRRNFIVNGVSFPAGIRDNDDVDTVLRYVIEQVAARVEPLHSGWCWGFNYRGNRNGSGLSNHASGTAVDFNAPAHPNGVATARTFSRDEINEIHQILSEVGFAVRWGGNYRGTPDSMHFEINTTAANLAVVADDIRGALNMDEKTLRTIVADEITKALNAPLVDAGKGKKFSVLTTLANLRNLVKG